jgi:uncharacterized protein YycO
LYLEANIEDKVLRELKTKTNAANNVERFITSDGKSVMCAFRDRSCSPNCAACEEDKANAMATHIVCLRGSFNIGKLADEID